MRSSSGSRRYIHQRRARHQGAQGLHWPADIAPRKRMSMVSALEILCCDWPQRRRSSNENTLAPHGVLRHRMMSFWQRNEDRLESLAYEIHQAYKRRARQLRTDLAENHDEAAKLIGAYEFCKRQLAQRGVRL
jgi:hypothetical protein